MNSNQGVSKQEVEKFSDIYEEQDDKNESPPKLEDMRDSLPLRAEPMVTKPLLAAA